MKFSRSKWIPVPLLALAVAAGFLACASTQKNDETPVVSPVTPSNDILELLTGFGESVSKRNFPRAVQYLVPEERAQILDASGNVPEDKQNALKALSLQRLIRNPAVHVENGYLAGINGILNRQSEVAATAADSNASAAATDSASLPASEEKDLEAPEENQTASAADNADNAELAKTTKKFFAAIRQKNWIGALSLVDENEKKVFLDEKGRLKESAKSRLGRIDTENKTALMMHDGKLVGVTLLVPAD